MVFVLSFSYVILGIIYDPCKNGPWQIDGSSPGTISSPGYAEGVYYTYKLDCVWIIRVEYGNVKLKIADDFDLSER